MNLVKMLSEMVFLVFLDFSSSLFPELFSSLFTSPKKSLKSSLVLEVNSYNRVIEPSLLMSSVPGKDQQCIFEATRSSCRSYRRA